MNLVPAGTVVARLASHAPQQLAVTMGGRSSGAVRLDAQGWQQARITVPETLVAGRHEVQLSARAGAVFTALHYWSCAAH
jgi:hypothetical protein